MTYTIEMINRMNQSSFSAALGAIFEHSSWVADLAWESGPFRTRHELHEAMMRAVTESPISTILAFLCGHPDLATRLKKGGYSMLEQQSAGLDQLSAKEYEQFVSMNRNYVEKFGFPFILAVRGLDKTVIMAEMLRRIEHAEEMEIRQALAEVRKITSFRLADLITN